MSATETTIAEQLKQIWAEETRNDPTPPPCPIWCSAAAGHHYDGGNDDGALTRFHVGREHLVQLDDWIEPQPGGNQARQPGSVQVSMLETVLPSGKTIAYGRPTITVYDCGEDMTSLDVERLAYALMRARDELIAIISQ